MAHKLIFDPHIPDDLAGAIDYYESLSVELANRFRQQVQRRFDDISERPESFPIDVSPVRFAKVERFPFLIFFTVKPKFVSIIAIVHAASEPEKRRGRTSS